MLPTPPTSPGPTSVCSPDDRLDLVLAGTYKLTEVLGVGAYGTVYRARDIHTNVEYAVKALNKVGLDSRQKKFQDREIRLHHAANQHPSVVSMVKILDSPECTYVVIEYCSEGDLFSKITEEGHYVRDDFKAKHVFLQILSAVQHCHARGIYHRDLKPENVLVTSNGWTVKLADFGLATEEHITSDFGCGSTFYMSPECQQSNPRPFACYASAPNDVWSLGVILVNLTCGRNPWKRACMEDPTFKAYMRDRNFLKSILPISDDLNAILQRVFEPDAQRRITLDDLRLCIEQCSSFTTPVPANNLNGIPTPPISPQEKPLDPSIVMNGPYEAIPQLEQLPAQQFPANTLPACAQPRLITPPSSGLCTPQSTKYTFAPRSAASGFYYPFYEHMPDFRRCGQMFSNFNVPNHLWSVTR